MPVLVLQVPGQQQNAKATRPSTCPYCSSANIQRRDKANGKSQHEPIGSFEYYRYRCDACGYTFGEDIKSMSTSYPVATVQRLAGLAWLVGMSVREVVGLFEQYGHTFSHFVVWKEGQKMAAMLGSDQNIMEKPNFTHDLMDGQNVTSKLGVVVAFDFGDGQLAVLGTVEGSRPWDVKAWLERLLGGDDINVSIRASGCII